MLKELTIKEVVDIVNSDENVYGVVNMGDNVYKIPCGYTGPKGVTKYVNSLRLAVDELSTKLS